MDSLSLSYLFDDAQDATHFPELCFSSCACSIFDVCSCSGTDYTHFNGNLSCIMPDQSISISISIMVLPNQDLGKGKKNKARVPPLRITTRGEHRLSAGKANSPVVRKSKGNAYKEFLRLDLAFRTEMSLLKAQRNASIMS